MAKTARKRTKKTTPEQAPERKVGRPRAPYQYGTLPPVDDLRLAPNGIIGGESRLVTITFAGGFSVRLLPMNVKRDDLKAVSGLVAEWLKRRG